jgi:hypothetical protein
MSFSVVVDVVQGLRVSRGLSRFIVAVCAGLAGCRNSDSLPVFKVYDVKGKVLLADGKALSGGWIYFVSKHGDLPITPSGVIGPDGTFSLVTGGSGEGAPPGEYKVRIEAPPLKTDRKTRKLRFPLRYNDEDSSGLVIKVRADTNQLEPICLK